MSFFTIIETILLGPLKLLFETIFQLSNRFVNNLGLSILCLSLIMNILVLPLYKRADKMQEESRDIENKLQGGISHIKKVFSGDEKMMILQTYYRQNHYKPTDALKGSISLLLEIPFFMAAYQFLSNLTILNGVSLGPIADLGAPDGMLVIGGIAINLLPIIMTAVNVISSAIYLKGFPLKTKIQLYGMALFFLVFLYKSPAGLVFYWTLNNVFSLVKTIFYKLKNPRKVLRILTSVVGLVFGTFGAFIYDTTSIKRRIFLIGIAIVLQLPTIIWILKSKLKLDIANRETEPNKKLFTVGSMFLTLLVGVLIPSTFIAASPQEYIDITYFHNPLWYVISALCMATGTFMVWMRVFYGLAKDEGKAIFDKIVWILCGIMLINYMFFGTEMGIITSALQYENGLVFSAKEQVINLAVLLAAAAILYFFVTKWKRIAIPVLLTAVLSFGVMSAKNVITIKRSMDSVSIQPSADSINFKLSQKGKNVVVLMIDRAMGVYIPYLFNENPELEKQFDGFTYYSNTISFGGHTNFGVPALVGGYEYTPVEMNKRDDELLVSKHNEALKVMPTIFAENGYEVTVCDPAYANYRWISDLTVFDDTPEINAFITKGKFSDTLPKEQAIQNNHRNFFCFSIMKSMPICIQPTIYSGGTYNQTYSVSETNYSTQTITGTSVADGVYKSFMDSYNVLLNLSNITTITEDGTNTFLYLGNETAHETNLLQEPEYVPLEHVDNTKYDAERMDRFTVDGRTIAMTNAQQFSHYQVNMAALMLLGDWFDYLRENDVYDNTRIIIVSDHGNSLYHSEELTIEFDDDDKKNLESYFPLLMVKDFNSKEFKISEEFMTNADVPTLATEEIISNPTNPFTGKTIDNSVKTEHDQYIIVSQDWDIAVNNGKTYLPAKWLSVKKNMWNKENWKFYNEDIILQEHSLP